MWTTFKLQDDFFYRRESNNDNKWPRFDLPEDQEEIVEFSVQISADCDALRGQRRGVHDGRQRTKNLARFMQQLQQVARVQDLHAARTERSQLLYRSISIHSRTEQTTVTWTFLAAQNYLLLFMHPTV